MDLERGFKAEARRIATYTRGELQLGPFDRLEPHVLARHLEIPVMTLGDLQATCWGANHFLSTARETFSALTVFRDHRRLLVHNDSHSPSRQNSNLAHELATVCSSTRPHRPWMELQVAETGIPSTNGRPSG